MFNDHQPANFRTAFWAAADLGVLVLSRENLEQLLDLTIRVPMPDEIYDEALQTVQTAQSKHELQQAGDAVS